MAWHGMLTVREEYMEAQDYELLSLAHNTMHCPSHWGFVVSSGVLHMLLRNHS